MKATISTIALATSCLLSPTVSGETLVKNVSLKSDPTPQESAVDEDAALVQVALLLDTSGSMRGLIDQARSQLWNVVAELGKAERQGTKSRLEIAVYKYGMNGNRGQGFLRQVVGFTDNLDEVSAALFSLNVGGSHENCGQVIAAAVENLEWSDRPDVYKAAFIAGNESFDQGPVSFGGQIIPLDQRGIVLNSIFCGSKQNGARQ